jgi:hypothetical protein
MKGERITTDELGRMMKDGFERTDGQIGKLTDRVDRNFSLLVDEIRLLRGDFKDLATTVRSLVSIVASHDKDIRHLKDHAGLHD